MRTQVALLNASYEPLGTVSFKHAVRMLFREVAIVEEGQDDRMIGPHPWPVVIRLVRYLAARWLYREAAWTRQNLLRRDRHTCAYCGGRADTVDHVLPASRGVCGSGRTRSQRAGRATVVRVTGHRPRRACRCGSTPSYRPELSWRMSVEARVGTPVPVAER